MGEVEKDGKVRATTLLSGGAVNVAATISGWLLGVDRSLLALDAPLGWPKAMGMELKDHVAGEPIATQPDLFFRRDTDRVVQDQLGKTPLDVGADRIARTAHTALTLLQKIKNPSGSRIPLAWEPDSVTPPVSAIEVYPAGTLRAYGIPCSGYKKAGQRSVRGEILGRLSTLMTLPADQSSMLDNANILDAAICLLAAADFLQRHCIPPTNFATARIEGWIWVKYRQALAGKPNSGSCAS